MLVLQSRGNREPVATSSVDDGADPRVPERGRIMPRCYEFDSRPGPAAVVSIAAAATTAGAGLTRSIVDERDTLPETTAQALALVSAMPGDLRDRLIAYRAHSGRLNPAAAAAYDRLVAHLGAIYTGQVGPAVGEPMPDFLLSNQNGELLSLERFLDDGPLVVSINRGHWCPYCKLDVRALAAITPDIRRLGAQVVSIMPETARFTKQAIASSALPFPVLSDVDLGYALTLGLVYWVGEEVKQLYDQLGLDLERFQGHAGFFLPIAAKFIVGRDGIVKARQVDVDFRQRMEPAAILDALSKL